MAKMQKGSGKKKTDTVNVRNMYVVYRCAVYTLRACASVCACVFGVSQFTNFMAMLANPTVSVSGRASVCVCVCTCVKNKKVRVLLNLDCSMTSIMSG